MADEALRELERAWRASPRDPDLAGRLVTALRRAGRVAPRAALDARRLPPRTIRASVPLEISAWLGDAQLPGPGSTEGGQVVELPEHSRWRAHVRGRLEAAAVDRLAGELVALDLEDLALDGPFDDDEDAAQVRRLLEGLGGAPLERLRLSLDWPLPASVAGAVAELPRLGRLVGRVDAGFDRLARSRSLVELQLLVGDEVTDAALAGLAGLERLESLWVVQALGGQGAARRGGFVAHLPSTLRTLVLLGCEQVDDATLGDVARLSGLTTLGLSQSGVTDAGLERLAGLRLESLLAGGPTVGDRTLRALSALPLRRLVLQAPAATPAGWERLPASVEELTLTHEGRDPPACWAAALRAARGLRRLRIEGPLLDSPRVDLSPLTSAPGLAELTLGDVQATPAALRDLARLEGLRSVQLSGSRWTDRHVAALATLPRLEALSLLANSEVGDGALRALVDCRSLRRLELAPVDMTQGAVARFRSARPDVEVEVQGELEPDRPGWFARLFGRLRSS